MHQKLILPSVRGHAAFMLGKNCDKKLAVGESVMNGKMKADTSRTITVFRNGVPLTSGANYSPGETLTVGVSAFSFELVIEARGLSKLAQHELTINKMRIDPCSGGATFNGGAACPKGDQGSRVSASAEEFIGIDQITHTATMTLPPTGQVTITAGLASKYGDVSLLPTFELNSST